MPPSLQKVSSWNPVILLLCYNRPHYLRQTLDSLTQTIGWQAIPVYISQDGDDAATAAVAQEFVSLHAKHNWKHWKRPRTAELGPGQPSTAYLAQHYKYALQRAFDQHRHSHVILLEDDMIFSPDFLELFRKTAWLLERDPTLWCVSSWNDNAFGSLSWDPARLFRNSFFPGLGWMMRRELWDQELGRIWPQIHWDHWMRSNANGRDCVCPEVPRNHNIGATGATMDNGKFQQKLANVIWAQAPADFGSLDYLLLPNYEAALRQQLHQQGVAVHLSLIHI